MSRKRSYAALDLLFFDWGLELTRLGIYFYAIGESLLRDWGFTFARLGTYKTAIGDLLKRRAFV